MDDVAVVSEDDETLDAYQRAADRYVANEAPVLPAAVVGFIDRFAALAGRGARVLEVGAGPGRHARLLAERGLAMTITDATPAFVALMSDAGLTARRLDVRHDELGSGWDAVYANAVFLHLSRAEFAAVLARLHAAVRPGGVLGFTVKRGDGQAWSTAKLGHRRHFVYWKAPGLRDVLSAAGWTVIDLDEDPGRADTWISVLARRP